MIGVIVNTSCAAVVGAWCVTLGGAGNGATFGLLISLVGLQIVLAMAGVIERQEP